MSQKIIISCDSTCDLSKEQLEKYNISVFPLTIVMDDKTLKDGINIQPEDIYEYKRRTGNLVKTCAPNLAECISYFKELQEEGSAVIHFDISSEMSSTNSNACLAAKDYSDIYAVDTRNLSTGSGLLILLACSLREKGLSASEIYDILNQTAPKVDASFVVDTLEYLHKGGRCSSIAALGANLLKLKPCIEVKHGKMDVGKKYRGKMDDCLMNYVADRLHDSDDISTDRIFITHSGCPDETVQKVVEKVKSMVHFKEICVTRAGCSVSTHCGPGTLGILFIRKTAIK